MAKLLTFTLLFIGTAILAQASTAVGVPEIDAGTGATAVALLGGGLLVLRSRKRKK